MKPAVSLAYLVALTASPVLASDVRIGAFRHPQTEGIRNLNQAYLDGVRGGLLAYNAWARKHSGKRSCLGSSRRGTTCRSPSCFSTACNGHIRAATPQNEPLLLAGVGRWDGLG